MTNTNKTRDEMIAAAVNEPEKAIDVGYLARKFLLGELAKRARSKRPIPVNMVINIMADFALAQVAAERERITRALEIERRRELAVIEWVDAMRRAIEIVNAEKNT